MSSLGRLGLVIGGAALGFAIGGPSGAAAFGMQVGVLAGTIVGNILFPVEMPDIEGPRMDPNQQMTSAYGDPIPIVYGRAVVGGRVAWYPGFVEHRTEEEAGGKGGPTQTVVSYTYTGSFRINVCEGPIDGILKIWMNRRLVYDATTGTSPILDFNTINESPGIQAIRIYLGTETQVPDTAEVADKGLNSTPAYRGLAGVVFENWPLDEYGGVLPQVTVLVSGEATEALSAQSFSAPNNNFSFEPFQNADKWAMGPGGAVWDNISQRQIGVAGASGDPTFPIVDSIGNIWGLTRERVLTKFDATSLLSLGTVTLFNPQGGGSFGDNNLHWEDQITFGGLRKPDGTLLSEKLLFLEQHFGTTTIFVSDLDAWQNDFGGVINVFIETFECSYTMFRDNDRFAWYLVKVNGSGVSELKRVNSGDGTVDLVYTLDVAYTEMMYDKWTNTAILHQSGIKLTRINLETGVEEASFTFTGNTPVTDASKNRAIYRQGPAENGDVWFQVGANLGNFELFNVRGEMSNPGPNYSPATDFGLDSSNTHAGFWDKTRNARVMTDIINAEMDYCYIGRFGEGDLITVQSIVDDVSSRVGLLPADIDTTALTEQLWGFVIGQRMAAKTALSPLSQMFFFNPVSEDFQVKFVNMGGTSIATIPEDDLGVGTGGETRVSTDTLMEEFIQEIELPEVMELGYNNPSAEYQSQYQRVKRPRSTTNSKRQKRFAFPGSFKTNADAHQRIESILYNTWTKRRPVSFTTAQRWILLSPGDVITITHEGETSQVAIGTVDLGVNNAIEFKGAADFPETLVSVASGAEGDQGQDEQVLILAGPSEFFVLDIPLLRAQDDGFGSYLAAGPFSNNVTFLGTDFRQSLDGSTFGNFGYVTSSRPSNHGYAAAALGGGVDSGLWDRTNSLTIQLLFGALASDTEDNVLDGANLLLVGSEIISFVTAVDNGAGSYTVSQLLRGRRGTEGEIDGHVVAEKVIELNTNATIRRGMDLSQVGVSHFYKGVTRGANEQQTVRKSVTVQGKSQWGWAPVHVAGTIASNDWTVTWERRSRLSPEWRNLLGSPGIVVDNWEVDVLSGPGGSVLATYTETATANGSVINSSGDSFFYDDADQVVDFGAVQTTVTFKIYPLTDNIGRGFPKEVTLVAG